MTPDCIIIHCSATRDSGTVSWQAIRRYHTVKKGWRDIGYHFGCERFNDHYEVLSGRLLHRSGAHCRGHNNHSVGFCLVGDFEQEHPPPDQRTVSIKYVAGLCKLLKIHPDHVYPHRQFNSGKTCPGTMFDMELFKHQVTQWLDINGWNKICLNTGKNQL